MARACFERANTKSGLPLIADEFFLVRVVVAALVNYCFPICVAVAQHHVPAEQRDMVLRIRCNRVKSGGKHRAVQLVVVGRRHPEDD